MDKSVRDQEDPCLAGEAGVGEWHLLGLRDVAVANLHSVGLLAAVDYGGHSLGLVQDEGC